MSKTLKTILFLSIFSSIVTGCAAGGTSADQESDTGSEVEEVAGQDISGKVLTDFVLKIGDEGDPCIPANFDVFQSLPGSQVTLKDSEGKILGVTNIEIQENAANPEVAGANFGESCAYNFAFSDVVVEDKFFSVEFGVTQLTPATVTVDELLSGLELNY